MHTVIIQSTFKFCLRLEVADSVKAAADIPVILEMTLVQMHVVLVCELI